MKVSPPRKKRFEEESEEEKVGRNSTCNSSQKSEKIRTESEYLNEKNLMQLERISECVKMDFGGYVRAMIQEEREESGVPLDKINLFKKKAAPFFNIETLQ